MIKESLHARSPINDTKLVKNKLTINLWESLANSVRLKKLKVLSSFQSWV